MNLKIVIFLCFLLTTGTLAHRIRVIGGTNAIPTDFPYMASIRRHSDNRFICAATIISRWNVLTTAHCIAPHENDFRFLRVVTGITNLGQPFEGHKIEYTYNHFFFEMSEPLKNNISVIKLQVPLAFNQSTNKIPLASTPPQSDNMAWIVGWGINDRTIGSTVSRKLKKAVVNTLTSSECQIISPYELLNSHFCTVEDHGAGACLADTGGPVVIDGELHGIIAFGGHTCDNSNNDNNNQNNNQNNIFRPDVHESVYHHLDFIRLTMEE